MRHVLKALILTVTLFTAAPAWANADATPAAVVEVKADQPAPAPAAAPAAPTEASAIGDIVTSAHQGNWKLAMAGLLSLLMLVIRKLNLHELVPFFRGDRGGSILVMVLAVLGAIASVLSVPDLHLSVNTFVTAIGVALTSAGGYNWLRSVISPVPSKPPAAPPATKPEGK